MKKLVLSLVFVIGMTTVAVGNTKSDLTKQVKIEQMKIQPDSDACFELGGKIFFFLLDNGYHPNQANDIATAIETVCNVLTE